MRFHYTQGWFRAHKRPLARWDEQKARQEHETGRPYTVLVGADPQTPEAFLEVHLAQGFVGVSFLDQQLRPYLEYKFVKHGERYFLQQSIQRNYHGDSESVTQTETYNFTPTGDVTIYESDAKTNQTLTRTTTKTIDVSQNWQDPPQLGRYEGFARIER